jgi:hypothetical protein
LLSNTLQSGYDQLKSKRPGVSVVAVTDDAKVSEAQFISKTVWEYGRILAGKNSLLVNLSARFVSNAHEEADEPHWTE